MERTAFQFQNTVIRVGQRRTWRWSLTSRTQQLSISVLIRSHDRNLLSFASRRSTHGSSQKQESPRNATSLQRTVIYHNISTVRAYSAKRTVLYVRTVRHHAISPPRNRSKNRMFVTMSPSPQKAPAQASTFGSKPALDQRISRRPPRNAAEKARTTV